MSSLIFNIARLWIVFLISAAVCLSGPLPTARALEEMTPEVVKQCKAATAIFATGSQHIGPAFCISSRGYFVTAPRWVQGSEVAELRLILNPGEPNEARSPAKFVHSDSYVGFLLIPDWDLPTLELAPDFEPQEENEAYLLTFPVVRPLAGERAQALMFSTIRFGKAPATSKTPWLLPIISKLPGNYPGAPLVDSKGRVLGIVSPVSDGPVRKPMVVAVQAVRAGLQRPSVTISMPAIKEDQQNAAHRCSVAVKTDLSADKKYSVDLTIESSGRKPVKYDAIQVGPQRFEIEFVPTRDSQNKLLRAEATLAGGTVRGLIADSRFTLGPCSMSLSDVMTIQQAQHPLVRLKNGQCLAMRPRELPEVEFLTGSTTVRVELAKASLIEVKGLTDETLRYVVSVRDGQQLVHEERRELVLTPKAEELLGPSRFGVDRERPFSGEKYVLNLAGKWSDVAAGGAGRYLVFQMAEPSRVEILDVSLGRIVHRIDTPAKEPVKIAAGLERLWIAYPRLKKIQTWELASAHKVDEHPLPGAESLRTMVAGAASEGPIFAQWAPEKPGEAPLLGFIDTANWKSTPLRTPGPPSQRTLSLNAQLRAGFTGEFFCVWDAAADLGYSVVCNGISTHIRMWDHGAVPMFPAPDGFTIATGRGLMKDQRLYTDSPQSEDWVQCIPAMEPGVYFQPLDQWPGKPVGLIPRRSGGRKLWIDGQGARLGLRLPEFPEMDLKQKPASEDITAIDKRYFLFPSAEMLVGLPFGNDKVVYYSLELKKSISALGGYFFIESPPPRTAVSFERFVWEPVFRNPLRKHSIGLVSGPSGMKVGENGRIEWVVDPVQSPTDIKVSLLIDQRRTFTFTIEVHPAGQR